MTTLAEFASANAPPDQVSNALNFFSGQWNSSFSFNPTSTAESGSSVQENIPPSINNTGVCEGNLLSGGYLLRLTYDDVVENVSISGDISISYDSNLGQYIENASSSFGESSIAYGDFDDTTKSLTFEGDTVDPDTKKSQKFVSEYVLSGDSAFEWHFYLVGADGIKALAKSGTFTRI